MKRFAKMLAAACALFLLLLTVGGLEGAVARLELRDGAEVEGDIRDLSNGSYTLRLATGEERVIPEKEIKNIHYVSVVSDELRLAGSNTVGEKLVPELAKAFVASRGAQSSQWEQGLPENERRLTVKGPQTSGLPKSISIAAHGSSTAFGALKDGSADIGMSSRPIKDGEVMDLASKGDLRGDRSEHTVALDGLAIIVHPSNPVSALSIEEVAEIFSGSITNWSQLGSGSGPIRLYARDDKSGTYDSFKTMVLEPFKKRIAIQAKRFESSTELSDQVAKDNLGIGFIGLPYVLKAKPLRIKECDLEYEVSPFAVKSEEYPLARRLFLYSPEVPTSNFSQDFVEYALSEAGQGVVENADFVNQAIQLDASRTQEARLLAAGLFVQNADVLKKVIKATLGASRLTVTFRFRTGSGKLDSKAVRDLDRLVNFMKTSEAAKGKQMVLLGFTDSNGDYSQNLNLSADRVEAVAKELRARGLAVSLVLGAGEEAPVACNDTKEGALRNRHVEVWLR